MSLIIPNATDTTGGNKYDALDQAEPDALDFEILSLRGSGVVSGCEVTSAGTSNTVNVSAGTVVLNGIAYDLSGTTGFGLATSPADKRFDLVVVRITGGSAVLTCIQGTNSATNPEFPKSASVITGSPSPTTNVNLATDVVLAAVYRNGSTTITSSRIVDKRAVITSSLPVQGAVTPTVLRGAGSLFYKTGSPNGTSSGVYVETTDSQYIELAQNVGAHMPIGGVCGWPSAGAIPSGFVEANGQSLSTTAYPALFAVYQYTHGGSGGSFNVPNYNDQFLRGTTNTSLVGTSIGSNTVGIGVSNLPAHTHSMTHTHQYPHTHSYVHEHSGTTDLDGVHRHAAGGLTAARSPVAGSSNVAGRASSTTNQGSVVSDIAIDGNTDWTVGHTHPFTTTSTAGQLAVMGATGSQSTSTTEAASSSTTGSVGSDSPLTIIPASKYIRWIIRASLGSDPSFTGGISGPWAASQTVTTVTGAGTYTLLTTDIGNLVVTTSGSAVGISLTGGLDMAPGQRTDIIQQGAGQITVSATGGATVNGTPGLKTRAQYSKASIICIAADTYILEGDIAA